MADLQYLAAYHNVCMQVKLAAEHLSPVDPDQQSPKSPPHSPGRTRARC
jgi:hypothetical protein